MTRLTGLRVDVDGSEQPFECDEADLLRALYAATDSGTVECVAIRPTVEMWVDEEGLLDDRQKPNPVGSALYLSIGGRTPIMGPVVFLGATNAAGDSTSLGDEEREGLSMIAAAPDPYRYLLFGM